MQRLLSLAGIRSSGKSLLPLSEETARQHQEGMVHHFGCISTTKSNHWHLCVTLSPNVDVLHPYPY